MLFSKISLNFHNFFSYNRNVKGGEILQMKLLKKSLLLLLITCLSFSLLYSVSAPNKAEAAQVHHWKLYTQAKTLYGQGKYEQAIPLLISALQQESENSGYYRLLAQSYEKTGQYQLAAETYYSEAKVHYKLAQKSGDYNTYFAVINIADKLNSELELYVQDEYTPAQATKLAKYEPQFGAYFGAYIEADANLINLKAERYNSFNKMVGKQHSAYFTYHKYGDPFPKTFAENVKAAGGAIQLALEPNQGLDAVKNDAYLTHFAKDAAAADVPIFLRYASEMNGDWVSWHGNPKKYIEKFRLVHDVMEKYAPNVVMVFSPSSDPRQNINDYYPGDNYVDWVGLSMYSVKFFNGNASQPADQVNPLDLLDYIYDLYADRKPIMISEYAATHFSKAGNVDTTKFAETKLSMLYSGIKLKYPRVKAVYWFSLNTLVTSHSAERMLNNFSLTENKKVLDAYSKAVSDSYYLTSVSKTSAENGTSKAIYKYENQTLTNDVTISLWAKTYDPYIQKVELSLDGKALKTFTQYPFQLDLPVTTLSVGQHVLKAVAYDSKGKVAISKEFKLNIGAPVGKLEEGQIKLFLNDKIVHTSKGKQELPVAPFTENGTTLVPLRFVSSMLGATLDWEGSTKKITIKSDKTIVLHVGKKEVLIDGKSQTLTVAPQTINGTTFVPLRFVNEQLGGNTTYSTTDKSILISSK